MKHSIKNLKFYLILSLAFCMGSCSDKDDPSTEATEEDIAEIIATSISDEDGGLVNDIENLIAYAEDECGYMATETFLDTETVGVRTFSLEYDINLLVICDSENNFLRVDYEYTVDREAELIRLDVMNNAVGDWMMMDNDGGYLLEGNYNYTGVQTFKVNDKNSYTTTLTISSVDLSINDAGDLLDGTLSITFMITSTDGSEESRSGSINVTSTNVGLLDVESFEFLYEIDFETGEVTQIER